MSNQSPANSVWDGQQWILVGDAKAKYGPFIRPGMAWDGQRWVMPAPPPAARYSAGRLVGGVISLLVCVVLIYLGIGWFAGFSELDADGNQFSGLLALFALGAWVVAAAFGVMGLTLLSRLRQ